ncbi:MAG: D-alanyl-D-alanine carboxypeptidase, partial [Clostridia bacterium]|nr:D-alanyl-D-alanine carboxypeptidase [Clostridia bacterium]
MKRNNRAPFYIALLAFALALFMPKAVALPEATAKEAAATTSEILIERDSLRVLKASNEHIKRGIASTTKILTAITVIENCPLDKVVEIPKEAEGVEGSSIYLRAGEKLTVEELLYGLMLRSGNDAAVALAIATSGNVKSFASLMNRTAKACGAIESNFTKPHGLDDENHYSTAYHLALITAHAMKNETFKKIADTEKIEISNENYDYPRVLVNKNKLLYRGE